MAAGNFFAHVIGLVDLGDNPEFPFRRQIAASGSHRKGEQHLIVHNYVELMPLFVDDQIELLFSNYRGRGSRLACMGRR
ncbi:hypothetical protein D3C75_953860 [compost metagenome]